MGSRPVWEKGGNAPLSAYPLFVVLRKQWGQRQNNLEIVRRVNSKSTAPAPNNPLPSATPNVMPSSRPPLMETSDNTATSSPAPNATARRSGRVTKAPEKFAPDAPLAPKRKRAADHDDEDGENESPEGGEDDDSVTADDEPQDSATEEPKRVQKRKKPAASQAARVRKPAAKKPKTNGDASGAPDVAPLNHAARLPSRPKKTVRLDIGRDGEGLYGG